MRKSDYRIRVAAMLSHYVVQQGNLERSYVFFEGPPPHKVSEPHVISRNCPSHPKSHIAAMKGKVECPLVA